MIDFQLKIGGKTKTSRFAQRDLGLVTFDLAAGEAKIGEKVLPAASIEHLFRYGVIQYIGDGAAIGKEGDEADFNAGIDDRLENIFAADFKRGKGEAGPIDNVEVLAKRKARAEVQTSVKEGNAKVDKDTLTLMVAAHFDNDKERFLAEAKAEIDGRKKTAGKIDLQALMAKAGAKPAEAA